MKFKYSAIAGGEEGELVWPPWTVRSGKMDGRMKNISNEIFRYVHNLYCEKGLLISSNLSVHLNA
jgi:hypothetical protein